MNRSEIILQHIRHDQPGIEIGPSHSPVAPKSKGFDVVIIDVMDREGLRKKFENHGVDLSSIEVVDYVWRGETYAALIKKPHAYDWIIASHVIEHTPDIIGFLNDCAELLSPEGVLSLAIPDSRYCFDHFRSVTSLATAIDAHVQLRKTHSPGTIVDFMMNAVSRNGNIAWASGVTGEFKTLCSIEEVRAHFQEALVAPSAIDVHAWCFTPGLFRLLISDLNALGLIELKEVSFHDTQGSEFYVTLGRHGHLPTAKRLDLVEQAHIESHDDGSPRVVHK